MKRFIEERYFEENHKREKDSYFRKGYDIFQRRKDLKKMIQILTR